MNNLTVKQINIGGQAVPYLDSREVADMLGKEHKYVLRDIEGTDKVTGIVPTLLSANLHPDKYFIESTYKDGSGKSNKCYLVTKMGCELLGNKQQGEKGILFTAKYVEAFNKMEEHIKGQTKPLSAMDQLRLQYQVLGEHEGRIDKIEGQLERLEVSPSQRKTIQNARHRRVTELLGGRNSAAYKDSSFRAKVYSEMGRAFNNYFDVPAYDCTPKNRFKEALETIESYNLSVDLSMEFKRINNQVDFEEVI